MNETKLLPCPFCGSEDLDRMWSEQWVEGEESAIECNNCNCIVGLNIRRHPDQSVVAWNTRAADKAAMKEE